MAKPQATQPSTKRKILHIIVGLNVGGAELMLKRLVLGSQQRGFYAHEVVSLTDLGVVGEALQKAGVRVHTLGLRKNAQASLVPFRLRRLITQRRPDVVQTWMYHADLLGGLAARSVGIRHIVWGVRTTDVSTVASRITPWLQKICARLSWSVPTHIVCAAEVSRRVHVAAGYDDAKMQVIANGFDLQALGQIITPRAVLRQQIGVDDDQVLIGSVGRFDAEKNPHLFVALAARLSPHHPQLRFVMVGRGQEWDNAELAGWIDQHGLRDRFFLLGQRSDVPDCLRAMDVFVLHSKTEGFPNVLGEAMAVGTLAVSLDVGDAAFLLDQPALVGQDVDDLERIVRQVLSWSPEQRQQVAEANQQRIARQFGMEAAIAHFENLYANAV